ncbi:MAG: sulfite exporter TauE/SafE family protein [Proteobacteria bacterium]|nr:sulfite exporter TauE/SafE family protein [Pseudomonadota bacterium]
MIPLAALMFIGIGLLAGLLIGAVGIGGVIVVPTLVFFADIPTHAAIAGAMMSYGLAGFVGTLLYARANSIRWDMVGSLSAGAMPGALAGALAGNMAPAAALEILIGFLTVSSGLHALLSGAAREISRADAISNPALGLIGAVTGFASALSGTGGPLVLVPILLWLDLPVLTAVGLSQVIQLPIAALATAGNLYYGGLDLALGSVLALGLAVGTWSGAKIAHALPRSVLRRIVSVVLVVVGALIFIKIAARRAT